MDAVKAFLKGSRKSIAYGGLLLIVLSIAFQVYLQVELIEYYKELYNTFQDIVSQPGIDHSESFWHNIWLFLKLASAITLIAVVTDYGAQQYAVYVRTWLQKRYLENWDKIKDIEGAHQRVQEDLYKLKYTIVELFIPLVEALFLLIAFLPLLIYHSQFIPSLPLVGEVPYSLVWVCLLSSIVGTGLMYLLGRPLAGLEYENQKREAVYRDAIKAGNAEESNRLWLWVRDNYYRMYNSYLRFNIVKYGYIQAAVILSYIAMSESILAGTITLGMLISIAKIFDRVESSLLTLARNWNDVVITMSTFRRLNELEARLK